MTPWQPRAHDPKVQTNPIDSETTQTKPTPMHIPYTEAQLNTGVRYLPPTDIQPREPHQALRKTVLKPVTVSAARMRLQTILQAFSPRGIQTLKQAKNQFQVTLEHDPTDCRYLIQVDPTGQGIHEYLTVEADAWSVNLIGHTEGSSHHLAAAARTEKLVITGINKDQPLPIIAQLSDFHTRIYNLGVIHCQVRQIKNEKLLFDLDGAFVPFDDYKKKLFAIASARTATISAVPVQNRSHWQAQLNQPVSKMFSANLEPIGNLKTLLLHGQLENIAAVHGTTVVRKFKLGIRTASIVYSQDFGDYGAYVLGDPWCDDQLQNRCQNPKYLDNAIIRSTHPNLFNGSSLTSALTVAGLRHPHINILGQEPGNPHLFATINGQPMTVRESKEQTSGPTELRFRYGKDPTWVSIHQMLQDYFGLRRANAAKRSVTLHLDQANFDRLVQLGPRDGTSLEETIIQILNAPQPQSQTISLLEALNELTESLKQNQNTLEERLKASEAVNANLRTALEELNAAHKTANVSDILKEVEAQLNETNERARAFLERIQSNSHKRGWFQFWQRKP